jgi:hypothetical protein
MRRFALTATLFAAALLAGCDVVVGALGIESPEKLAAVREADGKAIGGACRHAGRAIEDCYALNRKADKASVFAGWRDMNDYMRENKIEPVPPQVATQLANAGGKLPPTETEPAKPAAPSDKPTGKPAKRDNPKAHDS